MVTCSVGIQFLFVDGIAKRLIGREGAWTYFYSALRQDSRKAGQSWSGATRPWACMDKGAKEVSSGGFWCGRWPAR